MAERITFSELIAYRPLVIAWVWEMLCLAAVVYVSLTNANEGTMFGLAFLGAVPCGVAILMFLRARKRGELGPKPGSIVE